MHAFRLNVIPELRSKNLLIDEELVKQLCVKKNINLNDLPHHFLQHKCSNQKMCAEYGCDRWHGRVEKRVGSCFSNLISQVFYVTFFFFFFYVFLFVLIIGFVC